MRLAAQAKCGFYPAPPEAVAMAAMYLRPPAEGTCAILDPCCGKGVAIQQLAYALPGAVPWGIELDEKRSLDAAANIAAVKGTFLGPASFFGTSTTPAHNSFGFIWLNPPFDDEIGGGGRVEYSFLMRATTWLRPSGVLALICPEKVATSYDMQRYLLQWYEQFSLLPFPDGHRRFNEVVVLAVKRAKAGRLAQARLVERGIS